MASSANPYRRARLVLDLHQPDQAELLAQWQAAPRAQEWLRRQILAGHARLRAGQALAPCPPARSRSRQRQMEVRFDYRDAQENRLLADWAREGWAPDWLRAVLISGFVWLRNPASPPAPPPVPAPGARVTDAAPADAAGLDRQKLQGLFRQG